MAKYHFIARQDYRRIIEQHELTTVVDGDSSLITLAEKAALEEIKAHLQVQYDITDYFRPIYEWDATTEFKEGQYVETSADEYDPENEYDTGELCSTMVFTYIALKPVPPGKGPKQAPIYWEEVGHTDHLFMALSDNTNQLPDQNPEVWKEEDTQNPFFVTLMVDVVVYHLMARVGQVPDIRVKRYDDACKALKAIASGKLDIGLPRIEYEPRPTNRWAIKSGFKPKNDW